MIEEVMRECFGDDGGKRRAKVGRPISEINMQPSSGVEPVTSDRSHRRCSVIPARAAKESDIRDI
jgi:hypothetical protein